MAGASARPIGIHLGQRQLGVQAVDADAALLRILHRPAIGTPIDLDAPRVLIHQQISLQAGQTLVGQQLLAPVNTRRVRAGRRKPVTTLFGNCFEHY